MLDFVYPTIRIYDDIIIVVNHLDETYCYNFFGEMVVKDRVVSMKPIIYTTVEPKSEKISELKNVYKLNFGSYVLLLFDE